MRSSWVLGEQSKKMLRAESMADCIFNGTAKRPPMGLSEVTLTLVDPELSSAVMKVTSAPEEIEGATDEKAETPSVEAEAVTGPRDRGPHHACDG